MNDYKAVNSYRALYLRKKIARVAKITLVVYLLMIPVLYFLYRNNLLLNWWAVLEGDPTVPAELRDYLLRTGHPAAPGFDLLKTTMAIPFALLGPIMMLMFYMSIMVVQIGGLFWFLSRGRTYVMYPNEYDVSFDDVRGQPEIVESTKEALTLFTGFKKFRDAGGYPPHGILFEGPPGTGKTLLGKAIAGEAGVPFVYASGSSFNNMFMGVGNMRIARLFRRARKFSERYGGAVIFLDELDAVGGSRGQVSNARDADGLAGGGAHPLIMGGMGGMGGASMYVNELLIQMDGISMPTGFERHIKRWFRLGKPKVPQYNLMVIGATNQAATLDPALLRPGRFDRKLHVGLPTATGRADILQYYVDKVPHEEVDFTRLARATYGFSPAKIKNMVNEALIFALSSGRDKLDFNDLWQAKVTEEIGLKEPGTTSSRDQQMTAFHEAGHAVVAYVVLRDEQVQMASISKRGSTLGVVYHTPIEESHTTLREDLRRQIMVSLAGMAAEEIYFGEASTGHASDIQNATYTAARMLGMLGLGENLISYGIVGRDSMTNPVVEILRDPENRKAMGELLAECKAEATQVLRNNDAAMRALAERLLEKRDVPGEEIEDIMHAKGVARAESAFRPQLELTGNGWHQPAFVEATQHEAVPPSNQGRTVSSEDRTAPADGRLTADAPTSPSDGSASTNPDTTNSGTTDGTSVNGAGAAPAAGGPDAAAGSSESGGADDESPS